MKKAIVIGATGGTGAVIVSELVKRGVPTIAFGRSNTKLKEIAIRHGNPAHLSLAVGDACRPDEIVAAVQDADVLFHCANVPYNEMASKLTPLGESIMEAADRLSMKVVVVDGIYPYGRRQMDFVTEEHPKQPHTKKGKVRLAFEQMVFSSRWKKARPMIVRLPDYYGPTANQASYLGGTLEAIANVKMSFFIGNMRTPREYVYLPDAAHMIVELARNEHAYGENWNIPGSDIITGHEIVRIAQQASGTKNPVIALGRIGLSLLGLFVPVMKEVVEMLYLTEEPLRLSGEKYKRRIGSFSSTKPEIGITATIRELQNKK
ncbi:NAD-dependent epimerase/dehydratase family protein [Paenibacillus shunpengii]|uniref:NAD-dependent epimerase/dehydratase family protein n=1 Tax=Paenibacillus shunpengii TaxID=2054424 RepID=A0ABW5SML8_9BACL